LARALRIDQVSRAIGVARHLDADGHEEAAHGTEPDPLFNDAKLAG
jgi:hypothetical protein